MPKRGRAGGEKKSGGNSIEKEEEETGSLIIKTNGSHFERKSPQIKRIK